MSKSSCCLVDRVRPWTFATLPGKRTVDVQDGQGVAYLWVLYWTITTMTTIGR